MQEITIRKDGRIVGTVECYPNSIFNTYGMIGENNYDNLKDLLLGLQGFGIEMDDLFF